jgi:hypothetical protein
MLFGLTVSWYEPRTAPAGGLFKDCRINVLSGEYAVRFMAKGFFISGNADQSVEKSLEQVHVGNLV